MSLLRFYDEAGRPLPLRVRPCETFRCRLRGLMFRRALAEDEGLFFVEAQSGRLATAIHMFFVPFPIGVLWLDEEGRVVDKVIARPWRIYVPKAAARFYLEGPPALVSWVEEGTRLRWESHPPSAAGR